MPTTTLPAAFPDPGPAWLMTLAVLLRLLDVAVVLGLAMAFLAPTLYALRQMEDVFPPGPRLRRAVVVAGMAVLAVAIVAGYVAMFLREPWW